MRRLSILAGLALCLWTAVLLHAAEPVTTTSGDKRFVVVSLDKQTNGLILQYVESFFRKFSQTLRIADDLPSLLRIEIREDINEKITLTPFLVADKLCFKLTILSPGSFEQSKIDQYLSQIAFSAFANRGRPLKIGDDLRIVPEWIWLGYCRFQSPVPTTYYMNLIKPIYDNRKIPDLDRIIQAHSPSQIGMSPPVWEAFQWLVFRSVYLGETGGAKRIAALVIEDAAGRDPFSALSKVMDFPSNSDLQKWWTLQVTHFCENLITEPKSIPETEKKLASILTFNLPVEGALSLEETFIRYRTTPEIVEQLREKTAALGSLYGDSPPEYQPVIIRYQRLFQSLLKDPSTPLTVELDTLSRLRRQLIDTHSKRIDYVNWFIVTKTEPDRREFERIFRIYEDIDDTKSSTQYIPLPPLQVIKAVAE